MIKTLIISIAILFTGCKSTTPEQNELITKPMLWKISKDGMKDSYLFGTYHTRNPRITSLNQTIIDKFNESDKLYTELLLSDEEASAVNEFAMLQKPIPLEKRISKSTIEKIKKTIPSINIKNLSAFKTWAVAVVLDSQMDEDKSLPIMDEKLIDIAKKSKKEHGELENWKEQLSMLDKLSQNEQEELLSITMDISTPAEKLAVQNWYLSGEENEYDKLEQKFTNNSQLYKKIMINSRTNRNITMARRMDIIMINNSKKSYFFAVGAAHMPSKDGLLAILKSKGYNVVRI